MAYLSDNEYEYDIDIEENDHDDNIDISSEQPLIDIFLDKKSVDRTILQIYNKWLIDTKQDYLELQPSYQRELTWSFSTFNLFLDSVYHNFVMQPILLCKMNNFRRKTEIDKYECLDGQHRLTTLKLYINGEKLEDFNEYLYIKNIKTIYTSKKIEERIFYQKTPALDDFIGSKTRRNRNIEYRYMNEVEKERFDNIEFNIQIIESDLTQKSNYKAEIFNRIQNGSKVSGVELLKNINHPLCEFLRENLLQQKELKAKCIKHIQFYQKISKEKVIVDLKKTSLNECYIYLIIKCYLIYIFQKLQFQKQYDLQLNIRRALINNSIQTNGEIHELVANSFDEIIRVIDEILYIHQKDYKIAEPIFLYLFYTKHFEPHFYQSLINKLLCEKFMNEFNHINNAKKYYITKNRLLIDKIVDTFNKIKNELVELPQLNTMNFRQDLLQTISQLPPPPPAKFFLQTILTETLINTIENSQLLFTSDHKLDDAQDLTPRLLNLSDLIFETDNQKDNHNIINFENDTTFSTPSSSNHDSNNSIISTPLLIRKSPTKSLKQRHTPTFTYDNIIYNKTKVNELTKKCLYDICLHFNLLTEQDTYKSLKMNVLKDKVYTLLQ